MAETLPEEVVTHILGFLSVSDRKEASLVCKQWHKAAIHPILLKDTVCTFHSKTSPADIIKTLARRRTPNLILDQIDNNSFHTKDAIQSSDTELAQFLQSLTLKGSNIPVSIFMELIHNCASLTSLDLSNCNSLFLSGQILSKSTECDQLRITLKNVKTLKLASIRHLSDVVLNRFLHVCSSVENLDLSGNQIVFHSSMYTTCNTSCSLVTFSNIANFIKEKSGQIKGLSFSRTGINDNCLESLSQIPGLKLSQISLVCCRDISNAGIIALANHQQQIRYLDISKSDAISDPAMNAVCNGLQELHELNISSCRQITDVSVKRIKLLSCLRKLNVSSCSVLTSSGITAGLCTNPLLSLSTLTVHGCPNLRDKFVIEAAKGLPNLLKLDLSCCKISDVSIHFICKYLQKLQVLHLAWCKDITDDGLLGRPFGISHNQMDLARDGDCKCSRRKLGVNILNLPKIGEKEAEKKNWMELKTLLEEDDDIVYQINNLTGLQELNLSACPKVTDDSIETLAFSDLRKLDVCMCPNITDKSLIALAKNIRCLEELNIGQCHMISDVGLSAIIRKQHRLTSLNISNCDRVTDTSLLSLLTYSKRLQYLDVSMCNGVSLEVVEKLEYQMPHLHTVQKRLLAGTLY